MKLRAIIALFVLGTTLSAAEEKPVLSAELTKGLAAITDCSAFATVKELTAPVYAGRYTGHEGYAAAARWVASYYKKLGLKPIDSRNGYLQPYPSPYTIIKSAGLTVFTPGDAAGKTLEADKDYLPAFFSDSGRMEGGVTFVGWGISAPELGYDDYAGLDVRGKIVMCLRGQPDPKDARFFPYNTARARSKTAKDKGAVGLILVYPLTISLPSADWQQGFMPIVVGEKTADMFFKDMGTSCADIRRILLTFKKPLAFEAPVKIRYTVEAENHPEGIGANVMGYIEGSDPALRKEVVLIGAHLDHNGSHMGFTYPGANDNASGCATVLEIARAYSTLSRKPKRSILFVLFGGEERGMQGSRYLSEHRPSPFAEYDGIFNFDQMGEGDGGIGFITDMALKPVMEKADRSVGILRSLEKMPAYLGSDYAPFVEKGIPAVRIDGNGPNLADHGVGDTAYRVNPLLIADIAKIGFLGSFDWANR